MRKRDGLACVDISHDVPQLTPSTEELWRTKERLNMAVEMGKQKQGGFSSSNKLSTARNMANAMGLNRSAGSFVRNYQSSVIALNAIETDEQKIKKILENIEEYMQQKQIRCIDLFRNSSLSTLQSDHKLDREEFVVTLKNMGMNLNNLDVTLIVNHLDCDGDGKIDVAEFDGILRRARRNISAPDGGTVASSSTPKQLKTPKLQSKTSNSLQSFGVEHHVFIPGKNWVVAGEYACSKYSL
jgi:hypothetical protein